MGTSSTKIYQKLNLGEITEVEIKVLSDFENTFLANRLTGLFLDFKELRFLLESNDFQERIVGHKNFIEYFHIVFKKSMEEFKKNKVHLDSKILEEYESRLKLNIRKDLSYRYYDCVDEDTGDIVTILN